MKFSIKTDVFKNITSTLIKIASRGSLDASSNNVSITVSSGEVFFKARQIGFFVSYTVPCEGEQEVSDGSVVVPIQALESVVGSLIDATVKVELSGKKLLVSTNSSSSELYILESGEVSDDVAPKGDPILSLQREVLIHGFRTVQHAAAESEIKPEIASVYLYTKSNSVYFVATDAFRLAEMRFLSDDTPDDTGIIIPIKSVVKLLRVLEGVSDPVVSLHSDGENMFLVTGAVWVKTNSVTGSFPDYRSIMPQEFAADVTVLKSDVVNFLKKARLFADNLNKLSLSIATDKELTLAFSNETVGTTENVVPASVSGSVSTLPSFNYKFITDALSVISDDKVVFSVVDDPTKPMMIRGADDSTLTAIVSPLLDK